MELGQFQRRVGVAGLKGTEWEKCLHFFMNFPGMAGLDFCIPLVI